MDGKKKTKKRQNELLPPSKSPKAKKVSKSKTPPRKITVSHDKSDDVSVDNFVKVMPSPRAEPKKQAAPPDQVVK